MKYLLHFPMNGVESEVKQTDRPYIDLAGLHLEKPAVEVLVRGARPAFVFDELASVEALQGYETFKDKDSFLQALTANEESFKAKSQAEANAIRPATEPSKVEEASKKGDDPETRSPDDQAPQKGAKVQPAIGDLAPSTTRLNASDFSKALV